MFTLAFTTQVVVNVMLPLDTLNMDGTIKDKNFLQNALQKLKEAGVHGVMSDIWWGIAEPSAKQYKFSGYLEVAQMAKNLGLKFQPVMSFHKCGGNVGDTVTIPLPSWALDVAKSNKYLFIDQWGYMSEEYITPLAD